MPAFFDKLLGTLKSRRFWTAVGGVLVIVFRDTLGMDPETANGVVAMMIAWILGDSLNKTDHYTKDS